MNGIQIVLISGVALIVIYYAFQFRNALVDLLALLALSGAGIFFILFPDYTNDIAHWLGVGRGADLLFYCCILLFLFIVIKLFARIRKLEKQLTELIRSNALHTVKEPDGGQAAK